MMSKLQAPRVVHIGFVCVAGCWLYGFGRTEAGENRKAIKTEKCRAEKRVREED